MNKILIEAFMSPIQSQTRFPLNPQSKSSLMRLLSKLSRGAQIFQDMNKKKIKLSENSYWVCILGKEAESLARGQKDELFEMAQLYSGTEKE